MAEGHRCRSHYRDLQPGGQMRPYRSMLFVPGHKPDWIVKAGRSGADALIIDLEDSIPHADKPAARLGVAALIEQTQRQDQGAWIRVNALDTGWTPLDLAAIMTPALEGVVQPKVETADDVKQLDAMLTAAETLAGLPVGSVEILPTPETAKGLWNIFEICTASRRVGSIAGGGAKGGDTAHSVGYQWTRDKMETLYLRSRVLLAGRAAGLKYALAMLWNEIQDLEGLEQHCIRCRQIGYTGEILIHPSHVPIANRVYTPTEAEIAYAEGLLKAMDEGIARGDAAVTYEGAMVDYAMVKSAQELLELSKRLGQRE
jgi:citrate lyase subunit beta/citryl-CoA lyase